MRKKLTAAALLALVPFLLISCVRDGDPGEECYTERSLRLVFDWITVGPQSSEDRVNVNIFNHSTFTAPRAGTTLDILPGTYQFMGWESAGNITVDGVNVSVALNTDGTPQNPDPFTGGTVSATVEDRDGDQVFHVPMYQQTRPLIVRIQFTGDNLSLLQGVRGTFSGVSTARNIDYAFIPNDTEPRHPSISSGTVKYTFTPDASQIYIGERVLLGLDGNARQVLDLWMDMENDLETELTVDVTNDLVGFHTVDVTEPWYIDIVLNIGASFDIEIIDWISAPESWLVAQ